MLEREQVEEEPDRSGVRARAQEHRGRPHLRSRLLLAFERAEMSRDPAEQKRLMTIAVIGGGPTGVEVAGSIAELARYTLAKDFHRIRAETATVLLLEAGPRLLTAFPDDLASYALRKLTSLGVTVRTSCAVERITEHSVMAAGEEIGVGLAIWAAGVRARRWANCSASNWTAPGGCT